MRTITQRELRNNSAAIMTAVENGETFVVTRNGVEIAEVSPRRSRRKVTSRELFALCRKLPRVDYDEMRRDADEFFEGDLIDDGDPWERTRGGR
jgi:prevent-host-death family protein